MPVVDDIDDDDVVDDADVPFVVLDGVDADVLLTDCRSREMFLMFFSSVGLRRNLKLNAFN